MEELDFVFMQRDELLSLLSKLYPAHLMDRSPDDKSPAGWPKLLCIHSPKGPLLYHLDPKNLDMFGHLSTVSYHWDGKPWQERSARIKAWRDDLADLGY